jgi:hypothetical protein
MKRIQALSSGLIIQQDLSDAVRAVFYQTEYKEFLYATNGGHYSSSAFAVASTG